MAFYTDNFLLKRRQWWLKNIHQVQAFVGSAWYTGDIQKKELQGDTVVLHIVFPDLTPESCTITSIRVIDIDGETAAQQSDSIIKAAGQGILLKLELPIKEEA